MYPQLTWRREKEQQHHESKRRRNLIISIWKWINEWIVIVIKLSSSLSSSVLTALMWLFLLYVSISVSVCVLSCLVCLSTHNTFSTRKVWELSTRTNAIEMKRFDDGTHIFICIWAYQQLGERYNMKEMPKSCFAWMLCVAFARFFISFSCVCVFFFLSFFGKILTLSSNRKTNDTGTEYIS